MDRNRNLNDHPSMDRQYVLTATLDGSVSTWNLHDGENHLGRGLENDVQLVDASVSRRHAVLRIAGESAEIEELGSRNGSWINGIPIEGVAPVRSGDQIQLGDVVLRFSDRSSPDAVPSGGSTATRLQWDELRSDPEVQDLGGFWEAVMEAAQLMVLPRPLSKLLPSLLDLIESVIPAERILLLLRHEGADELELVASRPALRTTGALPLSKTLVDAVLRNRESVLVEDAPNDPNFAMAHSIAALNLRSAMAAPLFDNERVIGLVYAHDRSTARRFDRRQLRVFTMLANLIAIKITNARLLEEHREKQRLEHEMAAAGMIQRRILPARLPRISGYELAARLVPCRETAGDFYDVRPTGNRGILLAVGDVSGKGSGAALLTSLTLSALRVLGAEGLSIQAMGEKLNQHVFESSDLTNFVTLWMGVLDPATHRLTYLNAGHNAPFLFDAEGASTPLPRTGLPIGMFSESTFETREVVLSPGAMLSIYTDGLVEAQRGEDFFGDERLVRALSSRCGGPLEEVMDGLFEEARNYHDDEGFGDDCTVLLIRRDRARS